MTAVVTITINCDAGQAIERTDQCSWWYESDEGAWRGTVSGTRRAARKAGWRRVLALYSKRDEAKSMVDLCPSCFAAHRPGGVA